MNRLLQFFGLFSVLLGISLSGNGQAVGDYRTNNTGNWSNNGIWERYDGTAWVAAGNYPGQIAGTRAVTLLQNVTLDISPPNAIGSLRFQANLAQSNTNNNRTLNVTGDVIITSGTVNLSSRNGNRITLNVGGNLTMTGGIITETANTYGELIFAGSGAQIFTKTGGTISNNIRFIVNSGSNLVMGTGILDGSTGDFTLSAGATLTTANPEGIALTGSTGSIQVTGSRSFNTGADYVYNGSAAQITGTGLPATVGNLTVNNISGVTLTSSVAVTGTLTLTAGAFNLGANTLTLNGPNITGTPSNLATTASSSLVFGGTSSGVLIPTSVVALNNLSITNTSIITLQSSLTVGGTFNPAGGGLSIGANTLTLNGAANCGTLVGGATSNLIIGGTGAANIPGVTLNNLTLNKAAAMCGNVMVGGTLALNTGALSIGAYTLTLSNGASLSYGGGTLTGGAVSNLTIGTGTDITLNNITGGLNNFNAGRNITLGADLAVNGTLTLTSGIFTVGSYTLALNGPTIAGNPANLLTSAASSLVFGGTSAGVLIPSIVTTLTGLSITNTSIVTMQSSLVISGTFNPGGGGLSIGNNTLTLNGPINCGTLLGGANSNIIIGGSGSANLSAVTLNNLTVNRTVSLCGNVTVGGTLTLSSGALTVAANTLTLNGPAIAGTPTNLTTTSSSSLVYGGTAAGISIPSSVSNLSNLTINNSSGVTLSGNVIIAGILTMTQGNIITGAYTLTISNGAASAMNHVSGTIIGKLTRAVNTSLLTDYLFPIGTAAYFRPAIMNFSSLSAGTNITAEFISTPPAGLAPYTDDIVYLNSIFTEGYWRFFSSGLPEAIYTLDLTANGFTSYTLNSNTRITGRDSGNTTWRAPGIHGTQSGNDITRTSVSNLNTTSFDFALATGCLTALMSYGYSRNITIDYTKVSGGADLYNFPVLISLSGQNFLKTFPAGQIMNTNGYDIIFTDNNYNKLDHQLEYYNGTNGDLFAWVRIPVLSSTANTVIKILYGNPQTTTDPSLTSVWDSHYKGVWHLNNNSLNDFTSYNKSGTPYNTPTYPAGEIYNSLGLNGTNQYVEVINDPAINFAGNITVSAWVYMNAANRDQKIAGNQNNSSGGYKFGIYTNNKVEFEIRNSANTPSLNRDVAGGTVLNTGQWYYLAGISSDVLDSIKTFVNGISERPFKKTGILGIASNTLTIGKEPWLSSYYFSGRFDEIRISDKVRSNGWLRTEYNNQYSPSTFYTLDAAGVVSGNVPSAGICSVPLTLTFGYPLGGTYSGNPYISGNVFTPPAAGVYSITYTYNGGCGPLTVTKDFIITPAPQAPVAANKEYCTNQIAYLEASSGVNIRWYSGGTLVSTANPFSTGQTAVGTYNYTVTQTVNGCESAATPVSLIIYGGITINTPPQSVSICAGDNTSFSVVASGLNLTYQWQENSGSGFAGLTNGGIYSGVTTATLVLTNPGVIKNGCSYRCVISSSCGASPVYSPAALLTVTTQPVASFSYTGTPYCQSAANPMPTFSGGGVAGIFSSTPGLVFVNTATGQVNLTASTAGSYTVTNTIAASGGCAGATATSPITITSDQVWTGGGSIDWNDPSNWSCGAVPNQTTDVQIPDVTNKPVINNATTAELRNITIENGSSLTVASGTLIIYGSVTSNSGIDASDGTVVFTGSTAQNVGNNIFTGNTVKNLTVNNNAGVTLQGPLNVRGVVLVQNGALASDGNLTLISDATQTALIDGSGTGNVTGNVTMQRYLPSGFGYKYFSSPFQSATVGEFGDDMDLTYVFPLFYRFNENSGYSGWINWTNAGNPLNPMEGYAVNFGELTAPKTVDVTGLVSNGNLSVTLYNHDSLYTEGFNLVGNPYPSPVDWDAVGWTKSNIDDAISYFKASETDQYGGTYSYYVSGESSDGAATNIIPSMQGFFVHVTDGTFPVTGTLGVNNSVRVNDLTHPFLKSANASERFLLRAAASFTDDNASADPLVVYFDPAAENTFDGKYDALKLMNTDFMVTNFYSVLPGDVRLSINALPNQADSTLYVPLGLKIQRDGEVRFKLVDLEMTPPGMDIYFRDAVTGTSMDLIRSGEYRVTLTAGDYEKRFLLAFQKTTTGITDPGVSPDIFTAYWSDGLVKSTVWKIDGDDGLITVYDLSGRLVFARKVYETGRYDLAVSMKQGMYIIRYATGKLQRTVKLTIGM